MDDVELLSNVPLFRRFDDEALKHIAEKLELVHFPAGPIIRGGDPAASMYIIRSGAVKVVETSRAVEAVLAILKRGDSFGEVSLIDGEPRSASVVAMQPVECYVLRSQDFFDVLETYPDMAKNMLKPLAAMVRNADKWVQSLL